MIGLAHVAVVDPFLDVELLHAPEVLQHLGVLGGVLHQLRLDGRVRHHDAAGAEEDVDDFLVDAGPRRDLLGRGLGIVAHPGVGLDDGLHVGDHDLGIFLGEVRAHHDAVPGRRIGLDAVEDFSREAAERQQLGERHEIGVRVDLLFLQVGGADLRALADQAGNSRPAICGPACALSIMPCAAEPNGTLTTLPLRSDSSK